MRVFYLLLMLDYIIIGSGIAGISFAQTSLKKNKRILVFDDTSQNSSRIAAGLYNPVILKRFTATNEASEQLTLLHKFYEAIEAKLQEKFLFQMPILRKFTSIEEQNDWMIASDNPLLSPFLSLEIYNQSYKNIDSPFNFGEVNQTGYVDTNRMITCFKMYLSSINSIQNESFDYNQIFFCENHLEYQNIKTKHIVFAEGFGLHSNPFFNNLPLDGTKGEIVLIKASELDLDVIVNSSLFILPLGNHLFKVGATYNWKDKTPNPTKEGKTELIKKLKEIIQCDFEVIEHYGGIRPTVRDRKPLIGTHYKHKNLHILNGLGTRGVMLAPFLANKLIQNIENNIEIEPEYNIDRIYRKLNLL